VFLGAGVGVGVGFGVGVGAGVLYLASTLSLDAIVSVSAYALPNPPIDKRKAAARVAVLARSGVNIRESSLFSLTSLSDTSFAVETMRSPPARVRYKVVY
jgi:hypothetical protein